MACAKEKVKDKAKNTAYATVDDVAAGFRTLDDEEKSICEALLEEAAIIIDAYNNEADEDIKKLVSCRMVRRAISEFGSGSVPIGSSQGSMSALGYSQSWTSAGTTGELYLSKLEKKLLGAGNLIGSYSPVEGLVDTDD